jgi:hypothetical protein
LSGDLVLSRATAGGLHQRLSEATSAEEVQRLGAMQEMAGQSPRYNPAVKAGLQAGVQAQQDAAELSDLKLQEKRQAIEKNAVLLKNGGMSAKDMAIANQEMSGLARAIGANKEVLRIMNMDENLYKGGAAATVNYIQKTQVPAIMEAIETGVINSEKEQARVMSYLASVAGWEGGTTLNSTQKAEIAEFNRWFENKAIDLADAYRLDTAQWADKSEGRSQAELYDAIEGYRTTVDDEDANNADLTVLGPSGGTPLDEQQTLREQQGGFPGVVPAVEDAYSWYRGKDWNPGLDEDLQFKGK